MINKKIVMNYLSQFITIISGFISVPVIISSVGIAEYAYVGFYNIIIALLMLLDGGMSAALSRETAVFNPANSKNYYIVDNIFKFFFWFISSVFFIFSIVIYANANGNLKDISFEIYLLIIIAGIIKFNSMLFKNKCIGLQKFESISIVNIVSVCIRSILPIFYFLYFGNDISILFVLIFVSVILELTAYKTISDKELKNPFNFKDVFRLNEISTNIAFALSAFTVSLVWIAQTNLDKFLVFNFVSLEDYGRYSVAMVVSGGFIMLSQPLTQYLHPYFTSIYNEEFFRSKYEKYSLLLTTFLYFVFLIFLLCYSSIMQFWLRDMILVESIKELVIFFSLGNILMLNASFLYLMQYARGDLSLHIKVSLIVLISYGIFLYISLKLFGINGPGYAWLLINFIYLNFAAPFIHKHLTKFYMLRWQGIQAFASIFFIILVVGL